MPTLSSGWMAGDRARFLCFYTLTKSSDGTSVSISGTLYLQTRYPVTDTVNTWAVSGTFGSKSGSNLSIRHNGNDQQTAITTFSKSGITKDAVIGVSISGIEIYGSISATFTIDVGTLVPPVRPPTVTSFKASAITPTTFIADLLSVDTGGSSLTRSQVQGNTKQSPTGAWSGVGTYADRPVMGLLPNTTYYFRMRIESSKYGWGPWTGWKSFTTLPGVYVRHNGVWRNAIPCVRHNGVWRFAQRWIRVNGTWRIT